MKVLLQRGYNLHAADRNLLDHPPEGVTYVNARALRKLDERRNQGKPGAIARVRSRIIDFIGMPNLALAEKGEYDLVHADSLVLLTWRPWVVECETQDSFFNFSRKRMTPFARFMTRRLLRRSSCKRIIAWSEQAKRGITALLKDPRIDEKVVVIQPSCAPMTRTLSFTKHVRFVFAAYEFERKGGVEALMAFRKVHEKHPTATLTVIGGLPKQEDLRDTPGVTFTGVLPAKEVKKHLASADVLLYPTFHDSYGMILLEAASHGLAVITLEDYATKEIVQHGVDGYVIPGYSWKWYGKDGLRRKQDSWEEVVRHHTPHERARIVKALTTHALKLVEDRHLLVRMRYAALAKAISGSISIGARNRRLREVYDAALR